MNRYVVLDFETYPVDGKSYVMEIGCVEVIDGNIGNTFQTFVRPIAPVSDFVLNLTGILPSDLDVAPNFLDVMDAFNAFIQNSVVVAHNANLDCLSYESLCSYFGIEPKPFLWVDSQDIIKILDPSTKSLKLQTLMLEYGCDLQNSHRAQDDAMGLAKLLIYFSKNKSVLLTQREVSFLKKSRLASVQLLIKFLLINFNINNYEGYSTVNAPSFNELNSDDWAYHSNEIIHYNMSSDELVTMFDSNEGRTIIVTTDRTYGELNYVASPSVYVFPDKIPRLYPLITDVRVSHVELVELYGIMNWLRQTTTYQLTDMNDQLIQRYHQLVKGILAPHPLSLVNYIRHLFQNDPKFDALTECNYEMMAFILKYSPKVLSRFKLVLHHFYKFNDRLSTLNENRLSFLSLKGISKSIMNLSFIIDYLTYLGEDNLKFVQDFARLKSFVHLINEEKLQLFQKADCLVDTLSMNIYGFEKREVLINANVFETMEWQELMGSLNVLIHYLDEILKLFQKISFYIYADLHGWFSDLMYEFASIKSNAQIFLTLPKSGVLFIDSPVKHKPSNCRLVMKNISEHEFYAKLIQYTDQLFVHQQLYDQSLNNQVASFMGIPSIKQTVGASSNVIIQFEFNSHEQIRSGISKDALLGKLLIVVSSKKRLRYWKQKFRSFILSRQSNASVNILFRTIGDLKDIYNQDIYKIIFPEFMIQDILQPVHQSRLNAYDGSENDYIQQMFHVELHRVLDDLYRVSTSLFLINLDVRLKSIILV
jgi:DNA polymerase III epsilon subunit-like protein